VKAKVTFSKQFLIVLIIIVVISNHVAFSVTMIHPNFNNNLETDWTYFSGADSAGTRPNGELLVGFEDHLLAELQNHRSVFAWHHHFFA
jgi:hypothetical protein